MHNSFKHLIFYDGACGLCDRVVQILLKVDKKRLFVFAPLQGETAAKFLATLPLAIRQTDSLILVEDYQSTHPATHILSQGALRIAWLLGGLWTIIGILSFLPSWLFDWAYRLVARHRHQWFPQVECYVPTAEERIRFLP